MTSEYRAVPGMWDGGTFGTMLCRWKFGSGSGSLWHASSPHVFVGDIHGRFVAGEVQCRMVSWPGGAQL